MIDQMTKLETLDHTVLKMTASEGNMFENSFIDTSHVRLVLMRRMRRDRLAWPEFAT